MGTFEESPERIEKAAQIAREADARRGRNELVYFIEAVGLDVVKIGYARDIDERLRKLAPGCPAPLRLLGVMPGGPSTEHHLHTALYSLRAHGEWFRRGPELETILATLPPPPAPLKRPLYGFARRLSESTETAEQIAARLT